MTPENVGTLQPAWTYATQDAVSASPAIVDGVLYDGSWDGFFFALDATSGALKWRIQLDCQPSIVPLPEVCGEASAYCNPHDPTDIANAILRLMSDAAELDRLRAAGREWIKRYSWDETAACTCAMIERLLAA